MLALSSSVAESQMLDGVRAMKQMKVRVHNLLRRSVLGDLDIADTPEKKARGLLGNDHLNQGEGIWITGCSAIHTRGMEFPIDVVFIDARGYVVWIATVDPGCPRMGFFRSSSVLELPAGTAARTHTEIGDRLEFTKCT